MRLKPSDGECRRLGKVRWQLFSKKIIGCKQILCDENEKYSRYGKPVRNGSLSGPIQGWNFEMLTTCCKCWDTGHPSALSLPSPPLHRTTLTQFLNYWTLSWTGYPEPYNTISSRPKVRLWLSIAPAPAFPTCGRDSSLVWTLTVLKTLGVFDFSYPQCLVSSSLSSFCDALGHLKMTIMTIVHHRWPPSSRPPSIIRPIH